MKKMCHARWKIFISRSSGISNKTVEYTFYDTKQAPWELEPWRRTWSTNNSIPAYKTISMETENLTRKNTLAHSQSPWQQELWRGTLNNQEHSTSVNRNHGEEHSTNKNIPGYSLYGNRNHGGEHSRCIYGTPGHRLHGNRNTGGKNTQKTKTPQHTKQSSWQPASESDELDSLP